VSRKPGEVIVDVGERFEEALDKVRGAAVSALRTFRDKTLRARADRRDLRGFGVS
jgi:hypothetical protein